MAIVVDSTNVYWTNVGEYHPSGYGAKVPGYFTGSYVAKCSLAGCDNTPTIVARGVDPPSPYGPYLPFALAQDDSHLYCSDEWQCGIVTWPKAGGAPTMLAESPSATSITLSNGTVYWATGGDGEMFSCPSSGCAGHATTLWSTFEGDASFGQVISGLAVDSTNVYWSRVTSMTTCSIGDCPGTVQFWSTSVADQVATDDKNIYWTDSNPDLMGAVLQCAKPACTARVALATGRTSPLALAVDEANVYWTERGEWSPVDAGGVPTGLVLKCAIGGCNNMPTIIASGLTAPGGIAVDATRVYWTDYDSAVGGRVMSALK